MIDTLAACGFNPQRAIQIASNPWLTPARLNHILGLATGLGVKDRTAFIVAGIRDRYEPPELNGTGQGYSGEAAEIAAQEARLRARDEERERKRQAARSRA